MLVLDSSAAIAALVGADRQSALLRRLADDGDLAAPHLIDVEVVHVLRRLNRTGALTDDRAWDALTMFVALPLVRYPHTTMADRMWELRHTITAYDAAFVALAEALPAPLVTCDAKLAAAASELIHVEVYTIG